MSSDDGAASGREAASAASGALARLEVWLAASMALVSAGLSLFMPSLIASGGIASAQSFITLSPVFFPRLAFALLAALSLCHLLAARREARRAPLAPPAAGAPETAGIPRGARMILIAAAYAALVSPLGYGLSTLLMAAASARLLGVRRLRALLPLAVLIPVVVRFVFERLLLISLPRSEFEAIASVEDAIMKFLSGAFPGI